MPLNSWYYSGQRKQVTDLRDLKTLCKVSKTFYHFAAPQKYEVHGLTVRVGNEGRTDRIDAAPRLMKRVTKLRVTSTFTWKLRKRCIRHRGRQADGKSEFQQLCGRLLEVAGELQAGCLREFT